MTSSWPIRRWASVGSTCAEHPACHSDSARGDRPTGRTGHALSRENEKAARRRLFRNRGDPVYFLTASAALPAASLAASAALPAASLAASAALPAASFMASAVAPAEAEPAAIAPAAAFIAAEAAVSTALAAAEAAAATIGAAAAEAAAAAGASSFLPQAARATAATREASRSDLFMCFLKIIRVEQLPVIVGTPAFAEPQRSQARNFRAFPVPSPRL